MSTSAQLHVAPASPALHPSPSQSAAPTGDVTWRELRTRLWVGRSRGYHVGMIEQGRYYTFTDAVDGVHPGYRSLTAAQDAATGPVTIVAPYDEPERPSTTRSRIARSQSLLSPVSLGLIALALGTLVVVSMVLRVL